MDDISTYQARARKTLSDLGVNHDSDPLQEVVEAQAQTEVANKEKASWYNGFMSVGLLFFFAFAVWAITDIGHQQAAKATDGRHTQALNNQAAQHQAEIATLKTEHNNTLASEIKTWQANVANVRTESNARITKARQRLATIEQQAAAEKAETNQRIRDLIRVNEQFKTYYETPAHQRAADIIWPERLRQPTDTTGSVNTNQGGSS